MAACGSGNGSKEPTDNANSGKIRIAADEVLQPLVQSELDAFMGTYQKASIKPYYSSEADAFKLLLADSVRLAIVTRDLNEYEMAEFKKQTITPKNLKIATDAIALIVHPDNNDTLLTTQQVKSILEGKTLTWKEVGKGKSEKEIVCVFDKPNSGNLDYLKKKLTLSDTAKNKKIFSVNSNAEVINYVASHKEALGFIGVNHISDLDTPEARNFIASIRVVALSDSVHPKSSEYYQPYQAYLALRKYPFRRDVFVVSREARMGLGTGFMGYLASDIGQRIIQKSGLMAATVPVRLVHLKPGMKSKN